MERPGLARAGTAWSLVMLSPAVRGSQGWPWAGAAAGAALAHHEPWSAIAGWRGQAVLQKRCWGRRGLAFKPAPPAPVPVLPASHTEAARGREGKRVVS